MGNKADAKYHELMAHWWLASAVSGHCKQRDMFHGTGQNEPFTDEEKMEDAMRVAKTHINSCEENIRNDVNR